ncbi:MAG: endo-1,4-beta-xylanase [Phycisphaeraceae bacterium]
MLKFLVFENGQPAKRWTVRNAYLIGSDHSAMRGEVRFENGAIVCEKRESGPASFALQYPVGNCGELTVQTALLPEREEPYILSLELARHRLMMLYNKMEDWNMFDVAEDHPAYKRLELARKLFIEALSHQDVDNIKCDKFASDCLFVSVDGSEELALSHAETLLNRRKTSGSIPRFPMGCGVVLPQAHERVRAALLNNFDFAVMPTPWRELAPEEGEYRWQRLDNWVEWSRQNRLPVVAGPVVSFDSSVLPDWVYIWEHDYDTVRDLLYEHTERVITRYKDVVKLWNVVSGLHINSHFGFSFDQLLDLTRMATLLTKEIQPAAKVLIEIRQPFGEYYAANQRSIPPLMYADLLIQGAVGFDGLAIKLLMGQPSPGQFTRDLMQVSNLLDQFAGFNKPIYLTVGVPSEVVTSMMMLSTDPAVPVDPECGHWRRPWSNSVQAHWLEAVLHVAMGKPYVEAVAWHEVIDHPDVELPLSGLLTEDLSPKPAFRRMAAFRKALSDKQPMKIGQMGKGEGEKEKKPRGAASGA